MNARDLHHSTVAIHGGRALDSRASSILFPLYQTSAFVHDAVGVDKGFSYSRVSNPTVDALEKAIGALEGMSPAVFQALAHAGRLLLLGFNGESEVCKDQICRNEMPVVDCIHDQL